MLLSLSHASKATNPALLLAESSRDRALWGSRGGDGDSETGKLAERGEGSTRNHLLAQQTVSQPVSVGTHYHSLQLFWEVGWAGIRIWRQQHLTSIMAVPWRVRWPCLSEGSTLECYPSHLFACVFIHSGKKKTSVAPQQPSRGSSYFGEPW